MNELLSKILSESVLSEESKKEVVAAFETAINEAKELASAEARVETEAKLNEQYIYERDLLIESIDQQIQEQLKIELAEFAEDVSRFRDLEAEFAERLVEAKLELKDQLQSELGQLAEAAEAVIELQLRAELTELKEDIDHSLQNSFGRKVFEAFASEFKALGVAEDSESAEARVVEANEALATSLQALEEAQTAYAALERTVKLDEVLSPLTGRTRSVMEAILRGVETKNLQESYNTYISRVLRESVDNSSEKEDEVLKEGEAGAKVTSGIVKDGNVEDIFEKADKKEQQEQLVESRKESAISDEQRQMLRSIAGISA